MQAGLSCHEIAAASVGGALGQMLARLGASLYRRDDQRESQTDPQSLVESSNQAEAYVGLVGQRRIS